MAYDTTEAVAKFLSGFQMKITNRERDTVAPDYYVKYSLTLSKGGKDFSTTFVSDGEPTVTQVFSALADDALTLRKYSTDEFVDKLYAQGIKPSAALRAYDSCKETNLWMQDELYLYDHCEDICRYGTLDQLRDMGVYAIRESLADEILNDLSYDEDYAPTDDAKDTIISAIYATFEEKYGEDFAEVATDFGQDIDDIAGRANPYVLSVDTVRAVNEKGYDAVFAEQWKAELSECDIDPEAVSVDSEAHDMENGTLYLAGAHHDGRVSVEMRQLTDEGERLWGQLDYEDYLPLEGLTAMGKHYELGDENRFVHDLYNSPELCAAPRYVEQSFGCPSEEYEKEEGTLPHDFTTGKWRVYLIYPGERYGLDGCLTYELNAYSGVPAAAHRASYPLVEFYDTSQDAARFPGGQFVSRYYMTDLLEDDSIAVSLDTMLKNGNQFSLDGGIPAWTVEGDDLAKVNDFLKKSCMEFCGSLPGDEKDADGYSLSGEAKDATASRNGLSRNQMGIEEKAAECKEAATVLANGNAL